MTELRIERTPETDENESTYLKWLAVICLLSSLAGWTVQDLLSDGFVYWAWPLILIATVIFTMNGDNILESIVVLAILGLIAFFISSFDAVVARIGVGTIPGVYVALALSKITFAVLKEGVLGNRGFK
ncbi:MAG: hypothetical protein O6931_08160 [Gammaproteobacteria bacterium]|nr:hypothetical protein [Gammaproteobacteria bacterium]